jgi:hypothetical protein
MIYIIFLNYFFFENILKYFFYNNILKLYKNIFKKSKFKKNIITCNNGCDPRGAKSAKVK